MNDEKKELKELKELKDEELEKVAGGGDVVDEWRLIFGLGAESQLVVAGEKPQPTLKLHDEGNQNMDDKT